LFKNVDPFLRGNWKFSVFWSKLCLIPHFSEIISHLHKTNSSMILIISLIKQPRKPKYLKHKYKTSSHREFSNFPIAFCNVFSKINLIYKTSVMKNTMEQKVFSLFIICKMRIIKVNIYLSNYKFYLSSSLIIFSEVLACFLGIQGLFWSIFCDFCFGWMGWRRLVPFWIIE
jgi:hypothetical protein